MLGIFSLMEIAVSLETDSSMSLEKSFLEAKFITYSSDNCKYS